MSDASSSSDDDLEWLDLPVRIRLKNTEYFEITIPQYSEVEFVEHFRLKREVTEELAKRFKASEYYNYQAGGNGKLNEMQHMLVFLWFAGHQTASYRNVADRFNITISTLYVVIQRMVYFISNLSNEVIQWPSETERSVIERHFRLNGFPGVIGAIDGSHIQIDKTKNDPDSYYNRQHYFSFQMQVVCDHNRKIRDIFVGYPRSVHDNIILEKKCGDFYILGDSAYPCQWNLLTPCKDRGQLTAIQVNFNKQLSSNRYVIEHCFGLLKQRFRQLFHLKLKDISLITNFIRACCVLHNFAVDGEITILGDAEEDTAIEVPDNAGNDEDEIDNADGIQRRNFVAINVLNRL